MGGLSLTRISGRPGSYKDRGRVGGTVRWGVFLPGRLPGKHRKASSGSSAGSHPRGRLTSSPYPDPLPLLCSRGGRGGRAHSGARVEMPEIRSSELAPASVSPGPGRVFATSRRPPPGGLPVPPGGTHAGGEGVGVPGPSGWAPAKLRRREMESQHSPWAWGPAAGLGSLRAPFSTDPPGRPGQRPLAARRAYD